MKLDLTDYQADLILTALHEHRDGLSRYLEWVSDRPALPQIEQALGAINADIRALAGVEALVYMARDSAKAKSL